MDKATLIKFWLKFFDKGMREAVPEEDYMPVLDELIRGKTLNEPNKSTMLFAKMFQQMMKNAKCLGENNEMINSKLA